MFITEDTMEIASHFIHEDCLQIQIRCPEISMLEGEGQRSLIKESFSKVVRMGLTVFQNYFEFQCFLTLLPHTNVNDRFLRANSYVEFLLVLLAHKQATFG
jgi:hypothetical protein